MNTKTNGSQSSLIETLPSVSMAFGTKQVFDDFKQNVLFLNPIYCFARICRSVEECFVFILMAYTILKSLTNDLGVRKQY